MKQYLSLWIMLMLFIACQSQVKKEEQSKEKTKISLEANKSKRKALLNKDSLWQELTIQKGGCLVGGQRVKNGEFGKAPCVMINKEWQLFFATEKQELSIFLLSKLGDTTITRIHTCPFFDATAGEVAVYSLQNMYKINWFDFEEFKHFQNREVKGQAENQQAWLQNILQDEVQREQLKKCWEIKAAD